MHARLRARARVRSPPAPPSAGYDGTQTPRGDPRRAPADAEREAGALGQDAVAPVQETHARASITTHKLSTVNQSFIALPRIEHRKRCKVTNCFSTNKQKRKKESTNHHPLMLNRSVEPSGVLDDNTSLILEPFSNYAETAPSSGQMENRWNGRSSAQTSKKFINF